jgi:hypothetical protein
MSKQSFVTGQVLTAQQVNDLQTNDFNQTVSAKTASYTLVAADKGTRITMSSTSATTITVNTGLFAAGDTLFIQNLNTGVCTITAGTATVDTSASLALAQHEGGTLYFTSAGVSTFFKAAGAAPAAGGGMTLINTGGTALTGASVTISSIPQTYNHLQLILRDFYPTTSGTSLSIRINGASGSDYQRVISRTSASSVSNQTGQTSILLQDASADSGNADVNNNAVFNFYDYTQALRQNFNGLFIYTDSGGTKVTVSLNGSYLPSTSAAITSLEILVLGGTLAGGTALLYGVK